MVTTSVLDKNVKLLKIAHYKLIKRFFLIFFMKKIYNVNRSKKILTSSNGLNI